MHFKRMGILGYLVILFLLPVVAPGQEGKAPTAKEWIDKAMLFREAGDPRASEIFQQAVLALNDYLTGKEVDTRRRAQAYSLRARCHNFLGNNEQAILDLNESIRLAPEDSDTYYLRSFVRELMGHRQLSLADLETAAQMGNEKAQGELRSKGIQ